MTQTKVPPVSGADSRPEKDMHLGEPGLLRKVFRKRGLEGMFLFVTSRCNSKCRTCFYHKELNSGNDLSFDEIRTVSRTSPRFDKLWLSGGEPFMRDDLVDVIKLFYENNGVTVINLPTNGTLTDRIEIGMARLLAECPGLTVHLNFSLDGIGKIHDGIRGIPGNFKKTVKTMEIMSGKYRGNPRVLINAVTVITPEGYDGAFDLGSYLLKKNMVATHVFEVVRGDPRDPSTRSLTPAQIKAFRKNVMPLFDAQAENLFREFTGLKKKFARLFFLGFIKFMNDLQDKNYTGPHPWGMTCTAGKTTVVIDHNGNFRSCEMRPPIGNLKDYGFDMNAVMNSDAMKKEIREIGGGAAANCWCTHGCWIMSSLKFSPRALLFRIPMAYRRAKALLGDGRGVADVDIASVENY